MSKIKLGDLCVPKKGQIKGEVDVIIDYIDIASVDNESKKVTGFQTMSFGEAPSRARKAVEKGDILISTVRPNLNAVAILEDDTPNISVASTGFCILKCKDNVDNRFVFNFCKSKAFIKDMVSQATGASYPAVNDDIVRSALIPNYSYEEQCHISEILDRVSFTIEKRKVELRALDELIKARFVEMFGDPQINPFGWDVVNISEVVGGKVSNGFFAKRDDYADDGNVSVLGVSNIVNRMYSNVDKLPKTDADDKDIEKFEVRYGDMLFCRSSLVAEGIGKASIVPENVQDNVLFECHVIRLPLDLSKCVPEFMQALSTMDFFRNQVVAQSKTAIMTTIGQDGILKTDIILPPIDKQRTFYDFVHQVDKSKVAVQKALDETQMLFDSLMQKYFA